MKRLIAFLLLFIPTFCWADACTDPENYTIDKRCYVTSEQKQEKPYGAAVAIVGDNNDIFCTGTIVKRNEKFFVYTAKHCLDHDKNGILNQVIKIQLQDGRLFSVNLNRMGNYDINNSHSFVYDGYDGDSGDWAIFNIDGASDLNFVELDINPNISNIKVMLLGYGGLKILKDKEIETIKEEYIKFLDENIDVDPLNAIFSVSSDGESVSFTKKLVELFMEKNNRLDLLNDNANLKVSFCNYVNYKEEMRGCQSWSGNSGGGIFGENSNLVAIVSAGGAKFCGKNHAKGVVVTGIHETMIDNKSKNSN